MTMDFFSKTNEIHKYDRKNRPRAIFNPKPSLKAIGSFIARFFIKLFKQIEPGYISGYNEQEIGKIITDRLKSCNQNLDHCYSYDGSGHDSH